MKHKAKIRWWERKEIGYEWGRAEEEMLGKTRSLHLRKKINRIIAIQSSERKEKLTVKFWVGWQVDVKAGINKKEKNIKIHKSFSGWNIQ